MNKRQAMPSGPWFGYFSYGREAKRHNTRMDLTLEDGALVGQGSDENGSFTIDGFYGAETRALRWEKKYEHGTVVIYQGRWDADAQRILGRWQLLDAPERGTFGLSPGKRPRSAAKDPFAQPVAPWSRNKHLARLIFDDDQRSREALMADKSFARIVDEVVGVGVQDRGYQRTLMSGVRLSRAIAPSLHKVVDRCREVLGLEAASVELVAMSNPALVAGVVATVDRRVALEFSGALLEMLDDEELAFVVGHEFGHVVFDHGALPPVLTDALNDRNDVPPLLGMRYYAWMRYAELSADRAGMLCAHDPSAGARVLLKLHSGLRSGRFLLGRHDGEAMLDALRAEWSVADPDDWFTTHPLLPIRLRAMDLFGRSKTFQSVTGRGPATLTDAAMEAAVRALATMMEPSHLHKDPTARKEVLEFLALGGVEVALADGRLHKAERTALAPRIARVRAVGDIDEALAADPVLRKRRLATLAGLIEVRLSAQRRAKLIEDLAAIARSDRKVNAEEIATLRELAELIGINPAWAEECLVLADKGLD